MAVYRHKKTIWLYSLIVALLVLTSFVLISCADKPTVQEDVEPKINKVYVSRGYQKDRVTALTKEPICLINDKNTNQCETIDLLIELDNPQRRTVNMIYLNGVQYKKSVFAEGSDYQTVSIKQYQIDTNQGEFKLKIDKVYYQTPNEQKLATKATREFTFLINPEFNLTLDMSEANVGEGEEVVTSKIKYGSRLSMSSDYEMQNEDGYGKLGFTFAGWFDAPNGEGNRYNALLDDYKFNKDVTLYAHYDLTCEYEYVVDPATEEISYVKVSAITPIGKTNTSKKIFVLDRYEGYPVEEIGEGAFVDMTAASYELPSSVTRIGKRAFANARGVSIDFKNVQTIGEEAFLNVGSITMARNGFPPSLTEIGTRAFVGCVWDTTLYNNGATSDPKNPKTLVIPANVKKIGNEAFANSKFTRVYFWDGIYLEPENVGTEVFKNCSELQILYTGAKFVENSSTVSPNGTNGLNIIGDRWFFNDKKLIIDTGSQPSSVLTEGLEVIGEAAFMSDGAGNKGRMNSVVNIRFPNTLKEIKKEAFNNTALSQARFPDNKESKFETLGDKAFQSTFITNMEFYSLKTFAATAFFAAPIEYLIFDLKEDAPIVTYLPHSSTFTLNQLAGHGMPRYTKIYVPESQVNDYKNPEGAWWFNDKGKLDENYIQPILSKDSIYTLLGSDGVKISYDPIKQGDVIIGVRITNMFKKGSLINGRVEIPAKVDGKDVLEIGEYVVSDDGFTKVSLPSSIKVIHKNAFRDAKNLYLVDWYDKNKTPSNILQDIKDIDLEEIGDSAFKSTKIEKFQSNNNLKLIDKNAFYSCKELKYIELLYGNQMVIKENVFANAGSSLPDRNMRLWINLEMINDVKTGQLDSAFLFISNVSEVYIYSNYLNPSEGFVYPIRYSFLGQSMGEVAIYFSERNQINIFLSGRTNTYFDLGECLWDLGKPNTSSKEILYTKGTSP
ncbi:MAG TPA: leucine-rich repeat protein [Clostridia bacterium]|nr:leucine-rich repeat protein [Clostridia bacterium]